MPRFRIMLRQDAWVNHFAIIEADTKEDACIEAEHAWKHGDDTVIFEEDDTVTFDEILVDPDDAEEVDENGDPVDYD